MMICGDIKRQHNILIIILFIAFVNGYATIAKWNQNAVGAAEGDNVNNV